MGFLIGVATGLLLSWIHDKIEYIRTKKRIAKELEKKDEENKKEN